ncbi:hypothetical protein CI238_12895 [Colletotrichum incanum]|uniref:Uncharacterized protein n=1 Tax=Colletotrichum incanum TaxID=1573173 RepID=A0A166LDV8_COLIC|nr:hypothetical protein CI238_12895 [Colletotrichum incanum]
MAPSGDVMRPPMIEECGPKATESMDRTFLMPPAGTSTSAPAGTLNPYIIASAPSKPENVLIFTSGDVGNYLQRITGQPSPQVIGLPPVMKGSRSIAGGDIITTGWSIDYYGLSSDLVEYGNGIGWRSQENENVSDAWPRKYICCICSLKWAVTPLSNTLFCKDVTEEDRQNCRIPNPPDARRDPGFTRPQCSELHYYLDHEGTPNDPCIRGLCQTCRPVSLLPDDELSMQCCPPQVTNPNHLKEIYQCVMENCPFLTDQRRHMKAHLISSKSQGHGTFLVQLVRRIVHGKTLDAVDKEISSRLMHLFNDLDARMQRSIRQPINTVLLPEDISSPAVPQEHADWILYLGLHSPEIHRAYFFDSTTGKWYCREYDLHGIAGLRIVSLTTGRPVKPASFLWN